MSGNFTTFQGPVDQANFHEFDENNTDPVNRIIADIPGNTDVVVEFTSCILAESAAAAATSGTFKVSAQLQVEGGNVLKPFKIDIDPSRDMSLAAAWPLYNISGRTNIAIILTNDGTGELMTCPVSSLTLELN